jgi:PAS domain S-box-containing protein
MKDKPVILVVDDYPPNIELLEAHLAPQGYEIVKAANGKEALEKLSGNQIDLILLDVIMPGMDGFEVTRRVRQDNTHRLLPIILVTALRETADRVKGIEAGCDDFISKPIDNVELLARVRSLLRVKAYNDLMSNYRKELEVTKISEVEAREYAESVINTVREPLIALDQDLRVVTVSRSFYDFFKVNPEETVGQLIYDLGNKQWDIPKLRELLETILPEKATFENYEVEHDFATIGRRTMLLNARQIQRVLGKEKIILLAIEDITARKQVEEELKNSYEQVRSLASRLQEVREETRTNIAHDIHDELGGALAGLKMDLLRLESVASVEEDREKRQAMLDIIHGAKELINNTILSTRRIIMEQRPSVLDDFGLVAAMEWQLGEYKIHTDISFKFNVGQIEIDMDKNLATVVFRIFQEALANVIRHSKATEVYIGLQVDEGQLILEIKDNGMGITENEITGTGSIGILGMRERALAYGGEINIASESGKGTTLNLKIPKKITSAGLK